MHHQYILFGFNIVFCPVLDKRKLRSVNFGWNESMSESMNLEKQTNKQTKSCAWLKTLYIQQPLVFLLSSERYIRKLSCHYFNVLILLLMLSWGFEGSATKFFKSLFSRPLVEMFPRYFRSLTVGPGCTVVCESDNHRLSIPLMEHWMGRSTTTVKNE